MELKSLLIEWEIWMKIFLNISISIIYKKKFIIKFMRSDDDLINFQLTCIVAINKYSYLNSLYSDCHTFSMVWLIKEIFKNT